MNLYMQRLANHWPTLAYLITSQALLFYYVPSFNRFTQLARVGAAAFATIVCAYVFCYVVWFPQEFRWIIDLDIFDDAPNPLLIKKLYWYVMATIVTSAYLCMWLTDFHHAAGIWYIIWYAHALVSFILIYRVISISVQN